MCECRKDAKIIQGNNNSSRLDKNCDSIRLQALINKSNPGDIIELIGTFDFGEDQFVSIKNDITLKGRRSKEGDYLTVIKGGINTFSFGWDPKNGFPTYTKDYQLKTNLNTERWLGTYIIEDILFDHPTWSAIMVAASQGVEIRNNSFIGGIQYNSGFNAYGFDPPDGAMVVLMISSGLGAREPVLGSPSDISGHIIVEGNYFHGKVEPDPDGFDPVHGVSSIIHGTDRRLNGQIIPIEITRTGSSFTIQNNLFEDIVWGLFMENNTGTQIIRNNTIKMNPKDENGEPIGWSWGGISVQNVNEESEKAEVIIEENDLSINAKDFFSGILISSKAGIIRNNRIELEQSQDSLWNIFGDAAGIRLYSQNQDNLIEGNVITGTGQAAIVVQEGLDNEWPMTNNTIQNNDVSGFIPLDIKDIWSRLEGKPECSILPGSHYHLAIKTANNYLESNEASEEIIILDDTSSENPYKPDTYSGQNQIRFI